jgi:chemotaxis protein methyltransferase CheR
MNFAIPSSAGRADDQTAGCGTIGKWLNAHCGIHFTESKMDLLAHRMAHVVRQFNLTSLAELALLLEEGKRPDIQLAAVHAASTNYTYFFREPQVLRVFQQEVLSSYANRSSVRIWSAAASTGDEAYTLAIIACETYGRTNAPGRVSVLGTDISAPVIERAEAGIYAASHLVETPPGIVKRYFKPWGIGQFRIAEDVRKMCTFRRMNLDTHPFPLQQQFQVIFCRNVLYYFDREHQMRTLGALYGAAEPGGWLMTSVTEIVRDLGAPWTVIGSGVCRRCQ